MNNHRISVIVPVYNAEKWLRRCVDSILAQTYTDFELLLIDDGSTDGSGAICDEYAEKDSRVKVFHKPNGGVSSARNLGLDIRRARMAVIVSSGLLAAVVTAYCGPIMFVGLAVPHLARGLFRTSDHRWLMPTTLVCGTVLTLFCGILSRLPGFEGALPVNSVTALVGAPVIAMVLLKKV